jgi:hypothetical protein
MQASDWISLGAVLIAFIALAVSLMSLWKTHMAPFAPLFAVGSCTLRIYPIKSEKHRWFLPSFDLPLSLSNGGATVGRIEDLRIRVSFPNLPIPGHYEMFYAKWEVEGRKLSHKRFDWLESAVLGDWMPLIVLPRETKVKHLVFESRWDEPIVQERMLCVLEVRSSPEYEWKQLAEWDYHLDAESWSELAEVGSSFSAAPDEHMQRREFRNPSDLHRYTGSKQQIPKDGFRAGTSYLDYPTKEHGASNEGVDPVALPEKE